jgi:hypothetical protein
LTDAQENCTGFNNTVAYTRLISMACQNGPFGHVNKGARSVEFHNGKAQEAWEKLLSIYESDNMASAIALASAWTKYRL